MRFLLLFNVDRWEQVIYIVYQYLAMLHKEEPKEWIFNELKVRLF